MTMLNYKTEPLCDVVAFSDTLKVMDWSKLSNIKEVLCVCVCVCVWRAVTLSKGGGQFSKFENFKVKMHDF